MRLHLSLGNCQFQAEHGVGLFFARGDDDDRSALFLPELAPSSHTVPVSFGKSRHANFKIAREFVGVLPGTARQVLYMGGFNGSDPAIDAEGLAELVANDDCVTCSLEMAGMASRILRNG